MATDEFVMKSGDSLPPIESILLDGASHVIDLTEASSVSLHLVPSMTFGGTPLVAAGDFGADRLAGIVSYNWPSPQSMAPGVYFGEWEITWNSGDVETFPNDSYFLVKILPALA